jgi:hypothetical protein
MPTPELPAPVVKLIEAAKELEFKVKAETNLCDLGNYNKNDKDTETHVSFFHTVDIDFNYDKSKWSTFDDVYKGTVKVERPEDQLAIIAEIKEIDAHNVELAAAINVDLKQISAIPKNVEALKQNARAQTLSKDSVGSTLLEQAAKHVTSAVETNIKAKALLRAAK